MVVVQGWEQLNRTEQPPEAPIRHSCGSVAAGAKHTMKFPIPSYVDGGNLEIRLAPI